MSILRTRRFVLVGSASILATLLASSTTPIAMATSTGQTDGASNDAANYAKVILANHPAIYYRLGDSKGTTAVDASGNGRDGIYRGSPVYGVPGAIADDPDTQVALNQGTSHDSVWWRTGDQSYSGMFSVEAWVTPSVRTGENNFVSTRWDDRDGTFDVKLSNNPDGRGVRVDIGNGSIWYVEKTFPFHWRAHHTYYIAVVAAATQANIYVNGELLASQRYSCARGGRDACSPPLLYTPQHQLQIGQCAHFNEWFHGDVDEVAIYQHRLAADQVAAHYAAGL